MTQLSREKGELEAHVKELIDRYVTGELDLDPSVAIKPLMIQRRIKMEYPELPKPSLGAITNIIRKWGDSGAAYIDTEPVGFIDWTPAALKKGILSLRRDQSDQDFGVSVPSDLID